MKTERIIPTILITIATCAYSQKPPGPPPDIIAITLDKNHDHELSKREIRNSAKSLLKLDEDDDGALSKEELRPEPPRKRRRERTGENKNPPPAPPVSDLMEAIDLDGSGDLSKVELEAAPRTLLRLDKDDDGKVDDGEARSLEGKHERPPGPPGGR